MRARPLLRMAVRFARSGVATGWSRRRGPARPAWGLTFQALMGALQAERDAFEADAARSGFAWARFREDLEAIVPPSRALRRVKVSRVVAGGVPARWIVPPKANEAVIVYLHGGGYTGGSFATHGDLAARLALASGARVFFPEYRVAPEAPFPAAIDDVLAAWRWLVREVDPRRAVVMGDSAGGGLTFALGVALRDAGEPLPAGLAGLSPWVDLLATAPSIFPNRPWDYCSEPSMHGQRAAYAGHVDPRHPLVSPLYADLRGLPPVLVQVGGAEMLRDDGVRLVAAARAAGVAAEIEVYDDMPHVWHMFADLLPEATRAIDRLAAFIQLATSKSGGGTPPPTSPAVGSRTPDS